MGWYGGIQRRHVYQVGSFIESLSFNHSRKPQGADENASSCCYKRQTASRRHSPSAIYKAFGAPSPRYFQSSFSAEKIVSKANLCGVGPQGPHSSTSQVVDHSTPPDITTAYHAQEGLPIAVGRSFPVPHASHFQPWWYDTIWLGLRPEVCIECQSKSGAILVNRGHEDSTPLT